ncbi:twin-arginine translocation pathway signal protein [Loktanella sp. D2R18]|uniref:twin-arginine translocation signal domain-containing protein n=1 Tax=Rhodobacterales TaxID=204455 RepID=UPI000DEB02E7|nr:MULTISPECIES: twin-arginine translocation signal domain-containing protein [Rhodobacterales]MDO6591529.1 twin-arginine translocation signal domain-containing protein [Yoonia sp. 1_MG-2023]RBW43836.1 twin-arginine translocation pathway signal protein [Loktanella sp. D2R18]
MTTTKEGGSSRRDFLKLGVVAPAAAAVAVSGTEVAAQPVDPTSNKIQDTAHTRAYFESARF